MLYQLSATALIVWSSPLSVKILTHVKFPRVKKVCWVYLKSEKSMGVMVSRILIWSTKSCKNINKTDISLLLDYFKILNSFISLFHLYNVLNQPKKEGWGGGGGEGRRRRVTHPKKGDGGVSLVRVIFFLSFPQGAKITNSVSNRIVILKLFSSLTETWPALNVLTFSRDFLIKFPSFSKVSTPHPMGLKLKPKSHSF